MSKIIRTRKPSVLPFYAGALVFVVLCVVLPVYKLWALLVALGGAAAAFGLGQKFCPPHVVEHEVPFHTGQDDVDAMLTDIQQKLDTLHGLNASLPDPALSAAMDRIEGAYSLVISSPTKLIDIVRIGKQLLMTRGSLTTFSIANDVAKYFAIIPALFVPLYPALEALNIMRLTSPTTAILAAVIYNALIIVALIPLALKGVKYREATSQSLLKRNLAVYGLGGIVLPFAAIKLLDMGLTALGVA